MANRYCGEASIRIAYSDAGHYEAVVSAPEFGPPWIGKVNPPASLGHGRKHVALDSPAAYDEAARAACAFAAADAPHLGQAFEVAPTDTSGYLVRRYRLIGHGTIRGGNLDGVRAGLVRITGGGTIVVELAETRGAHKAGEVVHLGPGEFVADRVRK